MRTLRTLTAALRTGRASVREVLDEALARIDAVEPHLNAHITRIDPDALRREAGLLQNEIDAGRRRGPLHGVPIGIKDVVQTKGVRTTGGSAALEDWVPDEDAAAVARLRDAGALIVGKHNTHEFAIGVTTNNARFGQCRNPWDRSRIPGGSSGGSGAAVGAGLCVAAVGSDTGSSIRRPAAFNGAVGLKPRFGRVSRRGVIPVTWSLDHVGPIADTVFDAVAMLDAMAGPDPQDDACRDEPWAPLLPSLGEPHGLGIAGVPRRWVDELCEPGVARCFNDACRAAEAAGLRLVDIDPPHRDELLSGLRLISLVETAVLHERMVAERGERYSDELRMLVQLGRYIPAPHYLKTQQLRARVRHWMKATFDQIDLILTPTMPIVAPRIVPRDPTVTAPSVVSDQSGLFCTFGPLGGLQSISIPMGLSEGMPCGVLLTGPGKHERALLRLAADLEQRLPPLPAPPI